MTSLDLPEPTGADETVEALSRVFAAEPNYVLPDDPDGPDYQHRAAVHTGTLYGLTVETIGSPLRP